MGRLGRYAPVAVLAALGLVAVPACTAGSSGAGQSARPKPATTSPTGPPTTTPTTTTPTTTPSTSPTSTPPAAPATVPLPDGIDAVVTSITDGDTIRVRTAAGVDERVRLIGIDTPETRDPRRAVECFGREASAQTAALLPVGTRVRLERDAEARDRYDRLLATCGAAPTGCT